LSTAEEAATGKLTLRLPSSDLGPQASPHLLRIAEDDQPAARPSELRPWEVDVVKLTSQGVVQLLLSLPSNQLPGIAIGDSLHFLSESCKLALELVARGRVRPELERRGETWAALWRPVTTDGHDAAREQLLIRSMPPKLRAEMSPVESGNRPRPSSAAF
jgi:hypothetical protein